MNSSGCASCGGDGSHDKPIRVGSVAEEHEYISAVYGPGHTVVMQNLLVPDGTHGPQDQLAVRLADGSTRDVFFDIGSFMPMSRPSGATPSGATPSGATPGLANWQIGLLAFAAIGLLGFVYTSRPYTEEEKRYYRQQRSRA
jgi:hypothetical protein